MTRRIESFSNETVKRIRSLRDKKARRLEGMFLAEGLRIIAEARDCGILPKVLVYAEPLHPLAAAIASEAAARGADVIETTTEILAKMSGKDNPQMVLAVYHQPDTALPNLDRNSAPLWIVAQSLRDPGHIGTILRTGDAVAAGGLILVDDCADPFSVEAVRASMGAIFTQKVAAARWDDFLAWLRSGPGELVGTSLKTDTDYLDATYRQPCFLLVGNESHGLPSEYEAACDQLVKMPMLGKADSLNAAVATAVMAFHIRSTWRNPN